MSRADFFSAKVPRMAPEVPTKLQATPVRQERAKHAPRSSHRDAQLMPSFTAGLV